MQKKAYILGFISKCAEHGVDAHDAGVIFKVAQQPSVVEPEWRKTFRQQIAPAVANSNNYGGVILQNEYDNMNKFLRLGVGDYNNYQTNMINPYSDIYNQYYKGLMGKTEDGYDDDTAANTFARRMQEIDSGKPSTALNRLWRNMWYSPEENRQYFSDLANERAQSVVAGMHNDIARRKAIQSQVASLAPGYKPPAPKATTAPATSTATASTTPKPAPQQASQSFVRKPPAQLI